MDGELIFCTDSVLRFRSHYDETTALPLLAIQNTTAATDPWFLLRFFRHPVIIDAGTTLANIFVAIEPWKENPRALAPWIWSGLALIAEVQSIAAGCGKAWRRAKM